MFRLSVLSLTLTVDRPLASCRPGPSEAWSAIPHSICLITYNIVFRWSPIVHARALIQGITSSPSRLERQFVIMSLPGSTFFFFSKKKTFNSIGTPPHPTWWGVYR